MNIIYLILLIIAALITLVFIRVIKRHKKHISKTLIERFNKEFKSSDKYHQRINERYNIQLLSDPKIDLRINTWEKEESLLEKMKIHRARLKKFGKSKMNSKIYYQGNEGNVFLISEDGEKINI